MLGEMAELGERPPSSIAEVGADALQRGRGLVAVGPLAARPTARPPAPRRSPPTPRRPPSCSRSAPARRRRARQGLASGGTRGRRGETPSLMAHVSSPRSSRCSSRSSRARSSSTSCAATRSARTSARRGRSTTGEAGDADDGRRPDRDRRVDRVPRDDASARCRRSTIFGTMLACGAIGFLDDLIKVATSARSGCRAGSRCCSCSRLGRRLHRRAPPGSLRTASSSRSSRRSIPLGLGLVRARLPDHRRAANAVNLTDGLDGLAAGTSIISLFTLTAMAVTIYIRNIDPHTVCGSRTGSTPPTSARR